MSNDDIAFERAYLEERLVVQATEGLWAALEHAKMKKSELADKLGVQRSHVTQTLDGHRNLTLKTLAGFAWALGADVSIEIRPHEFNEQFMGGRGLFETVAAPPLPRAEVASPVAENMTAGNNSYALAA